MKLSKLSSILLVYFISYLVVLILGGFHVSAGENELNLNAKVKLTGGMLRAANVAYVDFYEHIKELSDTKSSLAPYLAAVENYDVIIEQNDGNYVIEFSPKIDIERGIVIKGGGGEYTITGDDYRVYKREFFK